MGSISCVLVALLCSNLVAGIVDFPCLSLRTDATRSKATQEKFEP